MSAEWITKLSKGDRVSVTFHNGVVSAISDDGRRVMVNSPRFYGGGWFEVEDVTLREDSSADPE